MARVELPARAIRDQGPEVNCCTSCALSACVEGLRTEVPELSPLFHYRMSGGRVGARGLTADAALAGGRIHGFCLQSLHPPAITGQGLSIPASQLAIDDATKRRLRNRQGHPLWRASGFPDRVHSWRSALNRRHPVFLAIATDSPYWDLGSPGVTTWVPSTAPPGGDGDHAVAVLGYDDDARQFIVQDSRGSSFGAGGQWFLSYRDAARSNRITESYEIG